MGTAPKRRVAISELMSSLIMIAITLVAGAAFLGYVNGQVGRSTQAVGARVAGNINFLDERETLIFASIGPPPTSLTAKIWVFNSGSIATENMTAVAVTYPSHVCTVSLRGQSAALVQAGQVSSAILVTLAPSGTCPSPLFVAGNEYTFEVTGIYGSTASLTVQL